MQTGTKKSPFVWIFFDWKGTLQPKTGSTKIAKLEFKLQRLWNLRKDFKDAVGCDVFIKQFLQTREKICDNKEPIKEHTLKQVFIEYLPTIGISVHIIDDILNDFASVSRYHTLFPGVVETLELFHKNNIPMGLIRNTELPMEVFSKYVAEVEVDHLFKVIVLSGEVRHMKPAREIFECAFQKTGLIDCDPRKILYIGNETDVDIKGGKQFGWTTVLIRNSEKSSNGLADYEIDNIKELESIVFPNS